MSQARIANPIAEVKKLLRCDGTVNLARVITSAQSFSSFGKSGNYGCAVEDIKFFVKLALFATFGFDGWEVPRPPKLFMVELEINMMRAIRSRLILPGHTPHFAEVLAVVECDGISQYIVDEKKCQQQVLGKIPRDTYPQSTLCEFAEIAKNRAAIDKFALVFSEYCEMSITDFLDHHAPAFPSERESIIISTIFQVYYTLTCARRLWPSFRHGDLLPYNVMIKLDFDALPDIQDRVQYLRYVVDEQEWNVPFRGFYVKIIDFGHGEIIEENIHGVIKRPGDLWVPDNIPFITAFENAVRARRMMTPMLEKLFGALNIMHITIEVTNATIAEHLDNFKDPESALRAHIFSALEGAVDDDVVLRTFTAPPHTSI